MKTKKEILKMSKEELKKMYILKIISSKEYSDRCDKLAGDKLI